MGRSGKAKSKVTGSLGMLQTKHFCPLHLPLEHSGAVHALTLALTQGIPGGNALLLSLPLKLNTPLRSRCIPLKVCLEGRSEGSPSGTTQAIWSFQL